MPHTDNIHAVKSLFAALVDNDVATAETLLTDDIAWLNTKLPTVRGKGVRRILRAMPKARVKFSAEDYDFTDLGDGRVRFDRKDTLAWGPLSSTFRVDGVFHVRDGRIARWDDSYRMREVLGGFLRRR